MHDTPTEALTRDREKERERRQARAHASMSGTDTSCRGKTEGWNNTEKIRVFVETKG